MVWMLTAWAMASLVLVIIALMTKRDDKEPVTLLDTKIIPSAPARPLPFVRGYRRGNHFPNRLTIRESDLKR